MKSLPTLFAASAVALVASAADASTLLFEETVNPLNPRGSSIFFESSGGFDVSFDFSSVGPASIDRIELTLDTSGALDQVSLPFFELWAVRAQGSIASGSDDGFDDSFQFITANTQTFVFDSGSDGFSNSFLGASSVTSDAFAHSVATSSFSVLLAEFSPDAFIPLANIQVNSATVRVFGEQIAPVPLPAGMPLLLGGLGALAFLRRRTA